MAILSNICVSNGIDPRFAASVFTSFDWFSCFALAEYDLHSFDGNHTGVWYKIVATGSPVEWLQLGAEWRRFVGLGPHLSVSIPQTPVQAYVTWTPIEPERLDGSIFHATRFLSGIWFSF